MFSQGQNLKMNGNGNGKSRANLVLLTLILGILSVASIGILVLAMLRQMYPEVFAAPGINKQLNYQGKLQDSSGVTVPDGSYGMKFTIYDSAVGGNILWTARESDACGAAFNPAAKSINVYSGVFSTLLGEAGDCPLNLDFADDAYYLGVTVGADPEMTPRKRIGASGYSFNADLLDGLDTEDSGGAYSFVPVTDLSGNFVLTEDVIFDTNTLAVDSANDVVGIGTASPSSSVKLHVYDPGTSTNYYAENFDSGGTWTNSGTTIPPYTWSARSQVAADSGANYWAFNDSVTDNYNAGGTLDYYSYSSAFDISAAASPILSLRYMLDMEEIGTKKDKAFIEIIDAATLIVNQQWDLTSNALSWTTFSQVLNPAWGNIRVQVRIYTQDGANNSGFGFRVDTVSIDDVAEGSAAYFQGKVGINTLPSFALDVTSGGARTINAISTSTSGGYGGYFKIDSSGGTGIYSEVGTPGAMVIPVANRSFMGYSVLLGINQNYGGDFYAIGSSANNYGVSATASGWLGGDSYGVYTDASFGNNFSYGVYSVAKNAPMNYGVYGEAWNAGYGVYGLASDWSAINYGVYGQTNSSNGWAGYFTGGQGTYTDKAKVGPAITAPAESLDVVGNIANLADANFIPVLKSSAVTGLNPTSVYTSGRYAYVVSSAGNTLEIFDVSDPVAPALISSTPTVNINPYSIHVVGKYAYIVCNTTAMEIFDVSDPAAPVSAGSMVTTGINPNAIYISGHYAYIASSGSNTLEVIDVSNPALAFTVGSVGTGAFPNDVYVFGKYAYVTSGGTNTLEIYDISNPMVPTLTGVGLTGLGPLQVHVSGRYAYVINSTVNTLEIFDVSNPLTPVSVSSAGTNPLPVSLSVSGRYAYVTNANVPGTIQVFDVSNPLIPVSVGSSPTAGASSANFISGRYAYVVNGNPTNLLEIFDISGLETTSAMVHSLEAGNLQVKNDAIIQGQLQVTGGIHGSGTGLFSGGIYSKNLALGQSLLGPDTVVSSWQKYSETLNGINKQYYGIFNSVESDTANTVAETFDLFADYNTVLYSGNSLSAANALYGTYSKASTASSSAGNVVNMYALYGESVSPTFATGTITNAYGVYGKSWVSLGGGPITNSYGGYFESTGGSTTNYGVYAKADDVNGYGIYGTSLLGWAGYFTGGGLGLYADRANIGRLPAANDTANTLVIEGSLCVDDNTPNCPAVPTAGYIYAVSTSITGIDVAENIPSVQKLEAGDVVSVDFHNSQKVVKSVRTYDDTVMGVVSTKPGLLLGGTSKSDQYPVALSGRVPVKVSVENGPIKIGDKLTTGNQPGIAMKATVPGPTIGIALEPFSEAGVGLIETFINVDWSSGITNITEIAATSPASSGYEGISDKLTADLDANGFAINNVSKIASLDGKWSIDENGLLKIKVEFERDKKIVEKDIYALSSTDVEIILSGLAKLDKGEILVDFSQVDKDFIEIIDQTVPLKISVTPTESCQGVYVAEKYPQGFKVKELNGGISDATFDWIVIGRRARYGETAESK